MLALVAMISAGKWASFVLRMFRTMSLGMITQTSTWFVLTRRAIAQERLKGIINDHLRSSNVYGKVRSFVRDFLATEEGVALEEDKLLTSLHGRNPTLHMSASWPVTGQMRPHPCGGQ